MSIYVMSDIHGNADAFFRMLREINFTGSDILYVLGDVIDRNPGSVEVLRYIKQQSNIVMLMGNHELMMTEYNNGNDFSGNWDYNGGEETRALLNNLEKDERSELIEWVENLPLRQSVYIKGVEYVLCHACPFASDKHRTVWERIDPSEKIKSESNKKYIIGHTPTLHFGYSSCGAKMVKNIDENLYYIDCGAAYTDYSGARLCCLRLEDEKEFYVNAAEKASGRCA